MKIQLKRDEPVLVQHCRWIRVSAREFRCGNVVLQNVGTLDRPGQRWHILLRRGDKLTRIACKSRPWGYGSAGQAKIGVSRFGEFLTKGFKK